MNIYEKILGARKLFSEANVKKTGKNNYQHFSYFELEDIVPTAIKICETVKLVPLFNMVEEDKEATLKVVDMEDPNESILFRSPIPEFTGKNVNSIIQDIGKVQTYQRRYLYMQFLDIVEHDCVDGNENNEEPKKPEESKSKAKPGKSSKSKPGSKAVNKPNNNPSTKPSNKPANKPKVTESELGDGTKIQEAKGSKPGGKPVAEKVEDPEDSNKLLAKLQKEQSKLYMPLKKKFKGITKDRDVQIKESHIIQACQELLGEGAYTPDDVGIVKEVLDI